MPYRNGSVLPPDSWHLIQMLSHVKYKEENDQVRIL